MSSVQQQYAELLALTKLYLAQEYGPTERIFADTDCYHYFREYAMRKAQPASAKQPIRNLLPRPAPLQNIEAPAPAKLSSPAPLPPTQATPPSPQVALITLPAAPSHPPLPTPSPVHTHENTPVRTPTPLQEPATQEPIPSPKEESTSQPATFILEAPAPAAPSDLKEVWDLVKERLPGVELLPNPPNDAIAKEAARQWERKPAILEVAILSFEVEPKHKAFLDNLSKALKVYGISAVVVNAARAEQEKAWPRLMEAPHVRLIIAGGYGLYTLTSLMQYYVEGERSTGPKLGKIPLLMLSDAALYLKEPSLKPSLWKSLKEMLAI